VDSTLLMSFIFGMQYYREVPKSTTRLLFFLLASAFVGAVVDAILAGLLSTVGSYFGAIITWPYSLPTSATFVAWAIGKILEAFAGLLIGYVAEAIRQSRIGMGIRGMPFPR